MMVWVLVVIAYLVAGIPVLLWINAGNDTPLSRWREYAWTFWVGEALVLICWLPFLVFFGLFAALVTAASAPWPPMKKRRGS